VIDPMMRFPGYALRRASAGAMAKLAADLAVLSVRPTEASVLMVVEANPGITQSEIGKLLDIARANMAPLAARLHKRHLMARARIDGRSHGLRLTEAGAALVRRIERIVTAYEAELLERVPAAHRAGFVAGVRALSSAWSQ
jgi:DNA-binding MarR family transcriptional regulator